jgi:hypothetical protein
VTDARWTKWAAGSGVLFVILFVLSFFVAPSTPSPGDSAAKVGNFYLAHDNAVKVSGLLTVLAVFVGLWFYTMLSQYFRSFIGQDVPATVVLVGAAIFGLSGALSAGISWALTDHTKDLNDGALLALNQISSDGTYAVTIVGLALLYSAAGVAIYRTGAFPRWLAWVSWVLALAALVPPIGFFVFLATPIWVLIVCFLLFRRPTGAPAADLP